MRKISTWFLLVGLLLLVVPLQAQDVDIDEIIFARDASLGTVIPIQEAEVFPDTQEAIYAIIEGDGLEDGEEIEIVWLHEDDRVDSVEYEQSGDDDAFRIWANYSEEGGLEEGDWRLEIYHDDELVGDGEFEVSDDEYIYPVRFAEDCGRETGRLFNEDTEFEEITIIYAYVEYANFGNEEVIIRWTLDGETIPMEDVSSEFDDEGWACFWISNNEIFPDGDYTIMLFDEDDDEIFESESFEVDN